MKRKSIVAIALSLFVAMALAGCGEKAETVSASEDQTSKADELAPAIASATTESDVVLEASPEKIIGEPPHASSLTCRP